MGGVFFRDAAADAATRQSAAVEKVRPHPQYCRRVWGKEGNATLAHGLTHVNYQTLPFFLERSLDLNLDTCLAKLNFNNLPRILQGFDLAVLKLGSSLRVSRWVKPLTTLHAVSTRDPNYHDYLKDQALYTAGMGVCEEGTESESSFFR